MTLGKCPLIIFCSRGTPLREVNPESITNVHYFGGQHFCARPNKHRWKFFRSPSSGKRFSHPLRSFPASFAFGWRHFKSPARKVDVWLPGKGNSISHGARPVHLIITMIKWIRASELSTKNSLSAVQSSVAAPVKLCLSFSLSLCFICVSLKPCLYQLPTCERECERPTNHKS